jgi:tetratricopeptide (TPR) repeat protein
LAQTGLTKNERQPVPFPDLSHLESQVAQQLREIEALWRPLLQDSGTSTTQLVEAYGELGMLYHAYQLEEPALVCYRNAERLDPHAFRWPYLQGVLHQQAGRLGEADRYYQRSLAQQPTHLPVLIRLARIRLLHNQLEEAETLLLQALQQSPNAPAALALLGEVALTQRRFADAVAYLNRALSAVPGANRLHYLLGMAYRGVGKQELARQHLTQRGDVGVRPEDPLLDALAERIRGERIYLLQGQQAFRVRHYHKAAQAFAKAVEAQPDSARARINLGAALAATGDRSGAMAQYRVALRLAPDNATAHYNMGQLLMMDNAIDEAIDHFQAAVKLQPTDQQAQLQLAQVLRRAGRFDEALVHLDRLLVSAPMHSAARLEEVEILVQTGNYRLALQKLQEGRQLMPEDGGLAHAMARLLGGAPERNLRNGARALQLAQRVFETRPTPGHAETVAMALAEAGRCKEAVKWQRRALRMGSESRPVAWLEDMVRTLGHYEHNRPCRYPASGSAPAPTTSLAPGQDRDSPSRSSPAPSR